MQVLLHQNISFRYMLAFEAFLDRTGDKMETFHVMLLQRINKSRAISVSILFFFSLEYHVYVYI